MTKIQIEEPHGFVKPWGYYVYIHFRKSNARPFYVGVGQNNRYRETKRTDWWRNCARKRGVYVEVVQCFEVRDDAFLLEMWLIAKFRHEGENLVNITDGGVGKSRGPKKKKVNYGIKYNAVTVYCSNGKVFTSFEEGARWCAKNGYHTARGSKILGVCDVSGRSMYGHAWSRIKRPDVPEATGRAATALGVSIHKIKTVYCSNGMSFRSVTLAAEWCRSEGYEEASQPALSSCLTKRVMSAYGHAWSYAGVPDAPKAVGVAAKALSSRHCMKAVICVETGEAFMSLTSAAEFNRPESVRSAKSNIGNALRNSEKTAYGYHWRFLDDTDYL